MEAQLPVWLEAAESVARAAGKRIREAHEQRNVSFHVEHKGPTMKHVDLVTALDKECEELIISQLRQKFPDHCFLGEESSAVAGAGPLALAEAPTWIIDPLDGTTNFVHGYPLVTVSIGLAVAGEL
eukprot:1919133-Pleurochrysis_carterae.AAC.1